MTLEKQGTKHIVHRCANIGKKSVSLVKISTCGMSRACWKKNFKLYKMVKENK